MEHPDDYDEFMNNEGNYRQLTNSEAHVYDYIQKHSFAAQNMTIRQLASASFSSTASVMRMVRKMGYTGYAEFQYRSRERPAGNQFCHDEERDCALSRFFEVTACSETYRKAIHNAAAVISKKKEILFAGDSYGCCVLEAGMHLFRSDTRKTDLLKYSSPLVNQKSAVLILITGSPDPGDTALAVSRIPRRIPVIMICCGGYIPKLPYRRIICKETDDDYSGASSLIPAVHTLELLRKAVDSLT